MDPEYAMNNVFQVHTENHSKNQEGSADILGVVVNKERQVTYNKEDSLNTLFYPKNPNNEYKIISEFEHNKKKETKNKVMIRALKNLANQTKKYLDKNDIKDHVPIVYLLNKFDHKRIENVCKELDLEEEKILSLLIRNALSNDFRIGLKEILKSYLVQKKVSVDQIEKYFEKEELEDLKELEKEIG